MTTRRDFTKRILAAVVAPAVVPTANNPFFVGCDFGDKSSCMSCDVIIRGRWHSGWIRPEQLFSNCNICRFWFTEIENMEKPRPKNGRHELLTVENSKDRRKENWERKRKEYMKIWFEEMSEYDNSNRGG